jgi:hypothetical protein
MDIDAQQYFSDYIDSGTHTKSAAYCIAEQYLNSGVTGLFVSNRIASPIGGAQNSVQMEIKDIGIVLSSPKKQRQLTEDEHIAMENAFFNSVNRVAKGRLISSS